MPDAGRRDVFLLKHHWILTFRVKALREEQAGLAAERARLKTVDIKRERPMRVYVQARLAEIKLEIVQLSAKKHEVISQLRAVQLPQATNLARTARA